ncbi:MAG TPA: DNA-directed RNA polymerase subunit alpha C-terminal domain-containing protein [Phycisphaerae bacterium]|nr:DNA-directed RNA polymerase subunit alpha C-terminal domain-containing protein [Phycisphaerae bacterium]
MENTLDLSSLFETETFDKETYEALKDVAFAGREAVNRFLELVVDLERKVESKAVPAGRGALKLGMCYALLGAADRAAVWLEKADDTPEKHKYLGLAYRELRRHREALEQFEKGARHSQGDIEFDCQRAESHLLLGETDKAGAILEQTRAAGAASADWHYTDGRFLHANGELESAMDELEQALELDERHAYASFHLAYLYDLHGNDEAARELYLRATDQPYIHNHALMNLAIIYEDYAAFDKAADCIRRVLAVDPTNQRARLYLKDVMAAGDMVIDDFQLHDGERRNAVLDIPVSDFELSVRSRNCLKKMNIHTLGDLLRTSETELLSYKNFGETSLKEIKAMLTQKGLSLGQLAHEKRSPMSLSAAGPATATLAPPVRPMNPEVNNKPVASLQLSVRSRKCLQSLGINTLGDLTSRSEAELMSARNFGQTSLEEIKKCLIEYGLSLRT